MSLTNKFYEDPKKNRKIPIRLCKFTLELRTLKQLIRFDL